MTHRTIRIWAWVHKWTSLICTLFLLMLCITGLPLIFHHEIEDAFDNGPPFATAAQDAPPASLDAMVAKARAIAPDHVVSGVYLNPDRPEVMVFMPPSWQAVVERPFDTLFATFDAVSGIERGRTGSEPNQAAGFLDLMLRLHVDMFMLLPGQLFLGLMGLLFLAAIVSGVVLYGPFTRRLEFGAVRKTRSPRTKWLDLHNLLGIVTLAWASVVGFTGALNELSLPLYQNYIAKDVGAVIAPWQGEEPPAPGRLASVDTVVANVSKALPDMQVTFVSFPGNPFGSPHHYFVWTDGRSALESRLQTTVLVEATTGEVSSILPMPWYIRAIEVSRPLHFGDYGGLPLKIIWALFDIATIVVLGSGLYLWLKRSRSATAARPQAAAAAPALETLA
ncbi:PepSY-associated TM helix domain-containing protein [Pedomonas mirosovicensis]|uniref:PepSY-associated TM helix domain-containing protein n=1 Tax=Pedomonas mirosovicensis TaxID=2908641 RepID=UPI002166E262|nr:PepSY-associated TM helix domain-containing protein [Pedomonas mirosovicensis]MCH8686255.1 PepSY domain-containing protein [Pedomonas mirosovicensis]